MIYFIMLDRHAQYKIQWKVCRVDGKKQFMKNKKLTVKNSYAGILHGNVGSIFWLFPSDKALFSVFVWHFYHIIPHTTYMLPDHSLR